MKISSVVLFLTFAACISSFSLTAKISPPPDISEVEKSEFEHWKNAYLKDKSDQSIMGIDYLNALTLSQSAYLKQHETNPINWKPWSLERLAEAQQSNKLIFLSIGYSSCHWCHVMNKESFTSIDIATILNKNFIAIKVDREELPHIDSYYMKILQQLKANAGWPLTAIITSEGHPVFIDSYLTKSKLKTLLVKTGKAWRNQPEFLLASAAGIASLAKTTTLSPELISDSKPSEINKQFFDDVNSTIYKSLDFKYGGLSGDVKFPSESLLLYLLDSLNRGPNIELEKEVTRQLDGMINGGIFDHVGGGFHRYSTDEQWLIPHYEKMLYNQALLIRVYSKAYKLYFNKNYLETVRLTTDAMIRDFYRHGKGFISSIDADYQGKEGGYYLLGATELESLSLNKQSYLSYEFPDTKKKGILIKNSTTKSTADKTADKTRAKLLAYRNTKPLPKKDNKVITAWNGLAISALVEASILLDEKRYLGKAKVLANELFERRYDSDKHTLSRTNYQRIKGVSSKSNTIAYLDDYAFFANALIDLFDATEKSHWLDKAKEITVLSNEIFAGPKGSYYTTSNHTSLFASNASIDTEIPSASSAIIDAQFKLNKRINKTIAITSENSQEIFLKNAIDSNTLNHLSNAKSLAQLTYGSTDKLRYFANGNGRVDFRCSEISNFGCQSMTISIALKDGWHINSNQPSQDYLIPTQVKLTEQSLKVNLDKNSTKSPVKVVYPKSHLISTSFDKEQLRVFSGEALIKLDKKEDSKRQYLKLPLQACNDQLCLLPEEMIFTF